jgi:hypothetical protein
MIYSEQDSHHSEITPASERPLTFSTLILFDPQRLLKEVQNLVLELTHTRHFGQARNEKLTRQEKKICIPEL